MDIFIQLIVWIIKAIIKPEQGSANAAQRRTMPQRQVNARQSQPALTASEQKTQDIWQAYRKKQEMLEAQFRAKAPK